MAWWKRLFGSPASRRQFEPEAKSCTVMFTNITDYVGISERMPLDRLPVFMNRYFEHMTAPIHCHEGVVDKYIGDIIMAYWTNPAMHAELACMAALDQLSERDEFHRWARENGFPAPEIRAGINSGTMRVGDHGTAYFHAKTVMGDEVNLASRLETMAKYYGVSIVISEATRQQLSDRFITRPLDILKIKGREGETEIFELVSRLDELPSARGELLAVYGKGIALYRQQRYSEAILKFQDAWVLAGRDGPCEMYIGRCRQLLDGVER